MRSTPAPQFAAPGASQRTRRHQTWLLTRTLQTFVLSKHVASKQPLKPANKALADKPIPDFAESSSDGSESSSGASKLPRNPRKRRNKTHVDQLLAVETALRPDGANERLHAMVRSDRRYQDALRPQPIEQPLGDLHHRRRDHDAIEGTEFRRKAEAIGEDHLDIAAVQFLQ